MASTYRESSNQRSICLQKLKKNTGKVLEVCVFETVFSSLRAFTLLVYFQYCCHYVKPHHVPDICQLSYKTG